MTLILPEGLKPPTSPTLSGYSRRQLIALERPEDNERDIAFASNEPCKREVEMVGDLQLVSIFTVDLDDHPVFHARVGYMESKGYFVPMRSWTDRMAEAAQRTLNELLDLPREVEKIGTQVLTPSRPSTIHKFVKLTQIEKDYLQAVQAGFVEPQVWIKEK